MALDRWVEDGVAPEKIIASHLTNGAVDRTQVLCPYPQVAIYNGTGDANVAESYHCEERSFWWPVEAIPGVKRPAKSVGTLAVTPRKQGSQASQK